MFRHRLLAVIALSAVMFAWACSSPAPTASPLLSRVAESPVPTFVLPEGPAFAFTLPLKAGDTAVSGITGRAGVPVRVVSVTDMAALLGQGVIGPDGTLEVLLNRPLNEGERVGLMIGDLTGTSYAAEEFLRGPGYQDTPFIGIVFASTLVEP